MLLGLLNRDYSHVFCLCMVKQRKLVPRGEGVKWMCRDAVKRPEAQKKHGSSSLFNLGFQIFLKLDCVPDLGFPEMPLSLNKLPLCLMLLAIKLDLINLETSQKLS